MSSCPTVVKREDTDHHYDMLVLYLCIWLVVWDCWNCAVWLMSHGPVVKKMIMMVCVCLVSPLRENWFLYSVLEAKREKDVHVKKANLLFLHSVSTPFEATSPSLQHHDMMIIPCHIVTFQKTRVFYAFNGKKVSWNVEMTINSTVSLLMENRVIIRGLLWFWHRNGIIFFWIILYSLRPIFFL